MPYSNLKYETKKKGDSEQQKVPLRIPSARRFGRVEAYILSSGFRFNYGCLFPVFPQAQLDDRLGMMCANILNLSTRCGMCEYLEPDSFWCQFCHCWCYAWRLTQCRSPKGGGNFLILHYIDKAGELESESWKSLRDGQGRSVKQEHE